ncbi:MAG: argininosuccinate synthase [Actinomycetota bacterium]
MKGRCVLAYSGGLDTSVAIRHLSDQGYEVIAVTVDVGQGGDPDELVRRGKAAGAVEVRLVDAVETFATSFVWPAVRANGLYEGRYPLVSALARPLIATKIVDVAREVDATTAAHGCTGKGNDQVRFEVSLAALAPDLAVLAPVRDGKLSRTEAVDIARRFDIPVEATSKVYSVDENLWGRTIECGPLEDPWGEPPADAFERTVDPTTAPDEATELVVRFEAGVPTAIDRTLLDPVSLIHRVGEAAGSNGFGRVDMVENRLVGIKSRELYEVPAALAIISAHRDLEGLTLERDLAHHKSSAVEPRWSELVYNGLWYSPLREALDAFVESTQGDVEGEVRLRFHRGSCSILGRRSDRSLYDRGLATYGEGDCFDQEDARGFVRLFGLPVRLWGERG